MSANHSRGLVDIITRLANRVRALEGQLSSATPKRGTATMTAGAVTVALPAVTAASQIMLTIQTPGGTVGAVYVNTKTAGVGFTIHSTSGADTSVVGYWVF